MNHSPKIRGTNQPESARLRPGGFTLIELLILIVIGGILLSLLGPVFKKAGEEANRAQCRDNIRLQLVGMHLFAGMRPSSL